MSLCAQQEGLPYRFVTVEGPATFDTVDRALQFRMAQRYLGDELAEGYVEQSADHVSVLVRITPNGGAPTTTRTGAADMQIGLSMIFQGSATRPDHEVYADEVRLAGMAEPLGFDSIWTVEHHFTGYTMVPDALQFLTYMAGCTERLQLGTMVVVLPWHDPVRVAEGVAMLDNLSGGRVILGIGRGLGRIEFGGFGVNMEESRARFIESAQLVLQGLEKGHVDFAGTYYQQSPRDLRPAPFKSFKDRTYASPR